MAKKSRRVSRRASRTTSSAKGQEGTLNMVAVVLLMLSSALIVALAVKIWG